MFQSWREILPPAAVQKGDELYNRAMALRNQGKTIYPLQENIFKAMQLTPPNEVKAVILGQDPYHNPGEAMGLSFSVPDTCPTPPSLANIKQELEREYGKTGDMKNDLTPWAEQGVLLLNTSLTVEHGQAFSHGNWGWNELTGAIISQCLRLPQTIVFLLWGSPAIKTANEAAKSITDMPIQDKFFIMTTHPSPFSANRPSSKAVAFIGSDCFKTANSLLETHGAVPVEWVKSLM